MDLHRVPLLAARGPDAATVKHVGSIARREVRGVRSLADSPYFYTSIPHTFDKINTALFLWLMIWVLGHRSEGTDTGLGSFRPFRAAEADTAIF
jgi:hypothetical protein